MAESDVALRGTAGTVALFLRRDAFRLVRISFGTDDAEVIPAFVGALHHEHS